MGIMIKETPYEPFSKEIKAMATMLHDLGFRHGTSIDDTLKKLTKSQLKEAFMAAKHTAVCLDTRLAKAAIYFKQHQHTT